MIIFLKKFCLWSFQIKNLTKILFVKYFNSKAALAHFRTTLAWDCQNILALMHAPLWQKSDGFLTAALTHFQPGPTLLRVRNGTKQNTRNNRPPEAIPQLINTDFNSFFSLHFISNNFFCHVFQVNINLFFCNVSFGSSLYLWCFGLILKRDSLQISGSSLFVPLSLWCLSREP